MTQMAWSSLGTISPNFAWQLFSVPVTGIETFRITNSWSFPPFYGLRAYLGQFFGTSDLVLTSTRIYPVNDTHQLIELNIPEDFKQAGIVTRHIGIKLGHVKKIGLYQYDWQVEISQFL